MHERNFHLVRGDRRLAPPNGNNAKSNDFEVRGEIPSHAGQGGLEHEVDDCGGVKAGI